MLQPLGDRVLIKPDPRPTQTESGLHLVEHWTPEHMGEVVKTGPGVECAECGHTVPLTVKVGDLVVFSHLSGQELTVDGERFLLMRESDLLAVYEGEPA